MHKRLAEIAILHFLLSSLISCSDAPTEPQQRAPSSAISQFNAEVPVPLQIDGVGEIKLYLNPDDKVITPIMFKHRRWEELETQWFVKSIRPGDTVVDIGANIGYYAVIAGKLVGDTGRVVAFEPDPASFALMQRNLALNGLSNVTVEQKAVSNEYGSIRLYLADKNKGDHRIYQPKGESRPYIEVEAIALDDYFDGQPAPDFIKVDTQGAEIAIFRGMLNTVRRAESTVIVVEYSPQHLAGFGGTGPQLLKLISMFGVEMYDVGGSGAKRDRIGRTNPRTLRENFTPRQKRFTNLFLVKGRPKLRAQIETSASGSPSP